MSRLRGSERETQELLVEAKRHAGKLKSELFGPRRRRQSRVPLARVASMAGRRLSGTRTSSSTAAVVIIDDGDLVLEAVGCLGSAGGLPNGKRRSSHVPLLARTLEIVGE